MQYALILLLAITCIGSLLAQDGQQRTQRRRRPNNNDAFYKLGPDSKPMEGVPKGKWAGPHTLPSEVFPGYQHTYYVYVPAQYDPSNCLP